MKECLNMINHVIMHDYIEYPRTECHTNCDYPKVITIFLFLYISLKPQMRPKKNMIFLIFCMFLQGCTLLIKVYMCYFINLRKRFCKHLFTKKKKKIVTEKRFTKEKIDQKSEEIYKPNLIIN